MELGVLQQATFERPLRSMELFVRSFLREDGSWVSGHRFILLGVSTGLFFYVVNLHLSAIAWSFCKRYKIQRNRCDSIANGHNALQQPLDLLLAVRYRDCNT